MNCYLCSKGLGDKTKPQECTALNPNYEIFIEFWSGKGFKVCWGCITKSVFQEIRKSDKQPKEEQSNVS